MIAHLFSFERLCEAAKAACSQLLSLHPHHSYVYRYLSSVTVTCLTTTGCHEKSERSVASGRGPVTLGGSVDHFSRIRSSLAAPLDKYSCSEESPYGVLHSCSECSSMRWLLLHFGECFKWHEFQLSHTFVQVSCRHLQSFSKVLCKCALTLTLCNPWMSLTTMLQTQFRACRDWKGCGSII